MSSQNWNSNTCKDLPRGQVAKLLFLHWPHFLDTAWLLPMRSWDCNQTPLFFLAKGFAWTWLLLYVQLFDIQVWSSSPCVFIVFSLISDSNVACFLYCCTCIVLIIFIILNEFNCKLPTVTTSLEIILWLGFIIQLHRWSLVSLNRLVSVCTIDFVLQSTETYTQI